jgi:hypothetical protein
LDSLRKFSAVCGVSFVVPHLLSMGEWVVGAFINLFGSIAINFGTNLLKLGHNEVWLKLLFSACIRLWVGRVAQLVVTS